MEEVKYHFSKAIGRTLINNALIFFSTIFLTIFYPNIFFKKISKLVACLSHDITG